MIHRLIRWNPNRPKDGRRFWNILTIWPDGDWLLGPKNYYFGRFNKAIHINLGDFYTKAYDRKGRWFKITFKFESSHSRIWKDD